MRVISTLLLLLFSLSFFAQDLTKSQYYFDIDGNSIEKTAYLQKAKDPKYTYIPRIIENDSAIVGTLYLREEIGIISSEKRLEIIQKLKSITGREINDKQTIVINFFNNPIPRKSYSRFFNRYVKNKHYNKFFKKNTAFVQFYISEKGYTPKGFMEDKTSFFEKLFLNYTDGDASYIIIKPNGHFLRRLSEHRQDEIIDKAKGDW